MRVRNDDLERQLRARSMSPEQAARNVVIALTPGGRDQRGNVIVVPTDSAGRTRDMMMYADDNGAPRVHRISGYVGGFSELALGVQLDVGTVLGIPQLRLVPDFAVGVGGGKSVLLAVGAQYDFEPVRVKARYSLTIAGRSTSSSTRASNSSIRTAFSSACAGTGSSAIGMGHLTGARWRSDHRLRHAGR